MTDFSKARVKMVEEQIAARGIKDAKLIAAMKKIPRHLFVEEALQNQAYTDHPLPIGEKQTISQPYMVALMTEALLLTGKEKVLEIGTGSGYQTAILCSLAGEVYSITLSVEPDTHYHEDGSVWYDGVRLDYQEGMGELVGSRGWDWQDDVLYVNVGENPDVGVLEYGVSKPDIAFSRAAIASFSLSRAAFKASICFARISEVHFRSGSF